MGFFRISGYQGFLEPKSSPLDVTSLTPRCDSRKNRWELTVSRESTGGVDSFGESDDRVVESIESSE